MVWGKVSTGSEGGARTREMNSKPREGNPASATAAHGAAAVPGADGAVICREYLDAARQA